MSTYLARILWIRMSMHLEWYTSYLSLKRNPIFVASAQRIPRPLDTEVVALMATCDSCVIVLEDAF